MKFRHVLCGIITLLWIGAYSQIKIGDNPQNIDPASILELESTTRAFVINRVTTTQMNAIIPIEGAMVYNTDIQCLHYYDGENWLNLCEALGLTITNNPIVHLDTTIAITRTDNNFNLEVKSITGLQINDRSITREDIALNTISNGNIQNATIQNTKIAPGPNNTQLVTNNGGNVVWLPRTSPIAFGKADAGAALKLFGATSIGGSGGLYTVTLSAARPDTNYTIQLTVSDGYVITVFSQGLSSFIVQITDVAGALVPDGQWYFTVFDY
ncbi:hypothetical protein [Muriicola jejuensis]|uniref:Uncharacterized protein n=1 Tax=Muriicola jejuensis TaxID=504488 RepID=A0A6P0UGN6_9FLAO|nr:hypothetical protein [Muriicola jejuensis]NER09286.1 hypothetical protein [Muriicola jejuensis]